MRSIITLSDHRLARHRLRIRAWLARAMLVLLELFGAFGMPRPIERFVRGEIARARVCTAALILLAAAKRVAPPRRSVRYGPPRVRSATLRGLIGSRLWRELRGRGRHDYVRALLAALENPEPLIVALARRLAHGLTRLKRAPALVRAVRANAGVHCCMPASADTS